MKWERMGRGRWCALAGVALGLLALLAACGGSNDTASPSAPDARVQTAAATIIGGQGATVVAGSTAAASAISQAQTAAPGLNATVTALAGLATTFAPSIPSAPATGGVVATAAANAPVIPTVPAATFVSGVQTAASATNPTVRILAPVSNSSIPGSAGISVGYLVTGGVNLPLTADANTPITGTHVVVLDDGVKAGQPVTKDAHHVHTMARSALIKDVAPGTHTATVVLVDGNNVPLPNPEAQAFVTFTTT